MNKMTRRCEVIFSELDKNGNTINFGRKNEDHSVNGSISFAVTREEQYLLSLLCFKELNDQEVPVIATA